jgi:pilus assembly protein CpaF
MVNGPEKIYIEKDGRIIKTRKRFFDENHLMRIIAKIVSQVGRRIDESSPMVDARLPDGSRINATIPPISVNGPTLNIRKFRKDVLKPEDIVSFGTATQEVMDFLKACVLGRLNIVISGGTGTGKTTLLNVLSSFIPYDERIITIEDAVELSLQQEHVVKLEARPPNVEGKGEIRIRDLVINALRMRPDRIIVGEVRGGEAVDMLQAMNTGHDGSLTTVHANSPRDALLRIETMVMMAGMELTLKAIRSQMASAIDLIIHMARLKDGSRKIMEIVEVQGMEGDTITLAQIFRFEFLPGLDERRKISGRLRATGIRPYFVDKLEDMGIALPPGIFEPDSLVL